MKLYYCFLFLCLFAQTPEAELLTTSAEVSMAQYGHGSVEVTQGRGYIHVSVKGEGAFTVQLIRVSDSRLVDGGRSADEDVFHFEKSTLSVGLYEVRVVFLDEVIRVDVEVNE